MTDPEPEPGSDAALDALVRAMHEDHPDRYVVLLEDPQTPDLRFQTSGPYRELDAAAVADALRRAFDADELAQGVLVHVVACAQPHLVPPYRGTHPTG